MSTDTAFLSVRLPTDLRGRLKAVAARRGVSLQQLMREAAEDLVTREEAEPPKLAEVIAKLRAHAPELKQRGVQHLYVFGSVARGGARLGSDIDLAIHVDPKSRFSLVTQASIGQHLEELLQRSVDLGTRTSLSSSLREDFERDAVRVFFERPQMVRRVAQRLTDIMLALDRIERRVRSAGIRTSEDFDDDTVSIFAWSLLIVGEAAEVLPAEMTERHPDVDWRGLAGLRDRLAHQYFRIEQALLWTVITDDLLPLRVAISAETQDHSGASRTDS